MWSFCLARERRSTAQNSVADGQPAVLNAVVAAYEAMDGVQEYRKSTSDKPQSDQRYGQQQDQERSFRAQGGGGTMRGLERPVNEREEEQGQHTDGRKDAYVSSIQRRQHKQSMIQSCRTGQ
jgi:hypothetical protein